MRIEVATLDDALRKSFESIRRSGSGIVSSRGKNREIVGAQIEISNPRARISRTEARATLYSALGECLWYLSGQDDIEFMGYYAPKYDEYVKVVDGRVVGAYGPRLVNHRGIHQINQVTDLLKRKTASRQAVIQLFDCADLADQNSEVPCTCTIQFLCRDGKVDAIATMRSNDAVRGMPHDVFAFTMLQEIVARALGADVGTYRHWAGSLHIYEDDDETVDAYLGEGWQQTTGIAMDPMPAGDPWPQIRFVLEAERAFRVDRRSEPWKDTGDAYWNGLIWLLEMRRHFKERDRARCIESWDNRRTKAFDVFVRPRVEKLKEVAP